MSSGARLILTNSSLSSLSMFGMGLFLLADGVHTKLDTPRSRFFWEGAGPKRKYHMVKWAWVCRPKDLGGLGITNSRLLNIAMMCKWIWKIAQGASGLWVDLLKAKYFPNGNFFEGRARGSPFWNDLQTIKSAFALGAKFSTGDGRSVRFWTDLWIGSRPLWEEFRDLYDIAVDPGMSVADALRSTPSEIHFKRELLGPEQASLVALRQLIDRVVLSDQPDAVSWALTSSGKFSVKSLYRKLCQGPSQLVVAGLWSAWLPLKIKLFLWQMFRNRLLTPDNVAKRNGPTNGSFAVCGLGEDADHVFFRCHLARFTSSAVREDFGKNWNPLVRG